MRREQAGPHPPQWKTLCSSPPSRQAKLHTPDKTVKRVSGCANGISAAVNSGDGDLILSECCVCVCPGFLSSNRGLSCWIHDVAFVWVDDCRLDSVIWLIAPLVSCEERVWARRQSVSLSHVSQRVMVPGLGNPT